MSDCAFILWSGTISSVENVVNFSGVAWIAQLAERILGKNEVSGPIPDPGSRVGSSINAGMPEWTIGMVCKTIGASLHRFESYSQHKK